MINHDKSSWCIKISPRRNIILIVMFRAKVQSIHFFRWSGLRSGSRIRITIINFRGSLRPVTDCLFISCLLNHVKLRCELKFKKKIVFWALTHWNHRNITRAYTTTLINPHRKTKHDLPWLKDHSIYHWDSGYIYLTGFWFLYPVGMPSLHIN